MFRRDRYSWNRKIVKLGNPPSIYCVSWGGVVLTCQQFWKIVHLKGWQALKPILTGFCARSWSGRWGRIRNWTDFCGVWDPTEYISWACQTSLHKFLWYIIPHWVSNFDDVHSTASGTELISAEYQRVILINPVGLIPSEQNCNIPVNVKSENKKT